MACGNAQAKLRLSHSAHRHGCAAPLASERPFAQRVQSGDACQKIVFLTTGSTLKQPPLTLYGSCEALLDIF
jgi:hypothetical protein